MIASRLHFLHLYQIQRSLFYGCDNTIEYIVEIIGYDKMCRFNIYLARQFVSICQRDLGPNKNTFN